MNERGLPRDEVLAELSAHLRKDLTYHEGWILGSMCTRPHEFATAVFSSCFEKNSGDPGLFEGTAELEKEAIGMIGCMLSKSDAGGNIVSGGTEANILALWAARKLRKKATPEVIVPVSAHASFDKAADLLGLRLIKVGLDDKYQVDAKAVRRAITNNTTAIVGIAGTTDLGVVDPIRELSDLAEDYDLYLHVDASFGGFVIPFLRELGHDIPEFDFKLPGVCSVTIDAHKMGMAPIPAGGILFRDSSLSKAIEFTAPYLPGGETSQATIVGTRPGASVAAVWALLKHLGRAGYREIVRRCMALTWRLAEEVGTIEGLDLVLPPTLNMLGIKSTIFDIQLVHDELKERGWAPSLFPDHVTVVVMPHITSQHVRDFVEDLRITSRVRGSIVRESVGV